LHLLSEAVYYYGMSGIVQCKYNALFTMMHELTLSVMAHIIHSFIIDYSNKIQPQLLQLLMDECMSCMDNLSLSGFLSTSGTIALNQLMIAVHREYRAFSITYHKLLSTCSSHQQFHEYMSLLKRVGRSGERKGSSNHSRVNAPACFKINIHSIWLHCRNSRPLIALWKHSSKQKKVRCTKDQLRPGTRLCSNVIVNNKKGINKKETFLLDFADPSLPLVIDIGCGFGVTLLGLARTGIIFNRTFHGNLMDRKSIDDDNDDDTDDGHGNSKRNRTPEDDLNMTNKSSVDGNNNYNFLGCDLSKHAISYARGIASRWDIAHRCKFCVVSAEHFVSWILIHYTGPVKIILIQYPTPYSLPSPTDNQHEGITSLASDKATNKAIKGGNSQLPVISSGTNNYDGFMVTDAVIESTLQIAIKTVGCIVMLQSNVQDVAVTMYDRFVEAMKGTRFGYDDNYFKSITNSDFQEDKECSDVKVKSVDVVTSDAIGNRYKEEVLHTMRDDDDDDNNLLDRQTNIVNELMYSNNSSSSSSSSSQKSALVPTQHNSGRVLTLRSVPWMQMGGRLATGDQWLSDRILSPYGKTETEAMYESFCKERYAVAWIVAPTTYR